MCVCVTIRDVRARARKRYNYRTLQIVNVRARVCSTISFAWPVPVPVPMHRTLTHTFIIKSKCLRRTSARCANTADTTDAAAGIAEICAIWDDAMRALRRAPARPACVRVCVWRCRGKTASEGCCCRCRCCCRCCRRCFWRWYVDSGWRYLVMPSTRACAANLALPMSVRAAANATLRTGACVRAAARVRVRLLSEAQTRDANGLFRVAFCFLCACRRTCKSVVWRCVKSCAV